MSTKQDYKKDFLNIAPFGSGLTRREFLKQAGLATLVAGLLVSKPSVSMSFLQSDDEDSKQNAHSMSENFSDSQKQILEAVQLQLFPADGDGPSSAELNALPYLEWALTDPKNREDGDKEFIISGIGWLQAFSKETEKKSFIKLSNKQQHKLLTQFSKIQKHENWMSILVYYLIEALLLDPVYGGNPNGIAWKWLEHQPGFPRPKKGQTYRELT